MTTDTQAPGSLAAALAVLQTKLPRIAKDKTAKVETRSGPGYQYTYSDLAQISAAVLPLMGELGLSFSARPTMSNGAFVLSYVLRHASGESDGGEYPLTQRGTPQQIGGEITYARRYVLCAVTGLAPEDDDDDAQAAQQAAAKREERASRRQQPTADDRRQDAAPDRISGAQMRKMQALFSEVGLADRESKLQFARETTGRDLGSATELTVAEAGQVIDRLERWAAQDQPPANPEER